MTDDEIHNICNKYNIKNYTVNSDGSIDVDGYVGLCDKGLKKLPLKFNYVSDYFDCGFNKLTSLEGSPKEVGGNFYCNNNKLTTLKSGPLKVGEGFHCSHNKLTTLVGSPREVGGDFNCSNNKLTSLEYAPLKVGNGFYCTNNIVNLNYNNYLKGVKRMNKLKEL